MSKFSQPLPELLGKDTLPFLTIAQHSQTLGSTLISRALYVVVGGDSASEHALPKVCCRCITP